MLLWYTITQFEYVIAIAAAATSASVDAAAVVVVAAKIRRIFFILSLCECNEEENY